jgi:hypothetical protein
MSNSQGNKKSNIPPILQIGRQKSTKGNGRVEKQPWNKSSIPPILQIGRQSGRIGHGTLDPKDLCRGLLPLPDNAIFPEKHLQKTLELAAPDMLERLQPYQLNTLYAPIPNCKNDDNAVWVVLMSWFDIFNAAFFGSGLQQIRDRIYMLHRGGNAGVLDRYTSPGVGGEAGKIEIDIDYNLGEGLSKEEHHIGTLLHEMLHVSLGTVFPSFKSGNRDVNLLPIYQTIDGKF